MVVRVFTGGPRRRDGRTLKSDGRRRGGGPPQRGLTPAMSTAAGGLPERSARPRQSRRSYPSSGNVLQLCRRRSGQQAVELWPGLDGELEARSTRCLSCLGHRGRQAEPLPTPSASTSGELARDPGQLAHKCRANPQNDTALLSKASAALQTSWPRPSSLGKHLNPRSALACAASPRAC